MGDYTYMLLRTLLALGIVLALIIGAVYAMRLLSGRVGKGSGGAPIRVLARSFIGQKSSIAIVEVTGEVLVLGISVNAVNLLARIEDKDVISGLMAHGAGRGNKGNLNGALASILGALGKMKK